MITVDGYSKDPNIVPEGIAITWSQQMLAEGFGTEKDFRKHFEALNKRDDSTWIQKISSQPKHEVLYCYIIIAGLVAYRCNISHYEMDGSSVEIRKPGAPKTFSRRQVVKWKRVVLTAPVVKAPFEIKKPGFQGFRYTTKLF